jgi:hypothetical protein
MNIKRKCKFVPETQIDKLNCYKLIKIKICKMLINVKLTVIMYLITLFQTKA